MKIEIFSITVILLFLFVLLFFIFFVKYKKEIYENTIVKKLESANAPEHIAFIIAEELKHISDADFFVLVEYKYFKMRILAAVPDKKINTAASAHEIYYILKNLTENISSIITQKNILSEHFKNYFPIFNYKCFQIIPVYIDESKIVTFEFYKETGDFISMNYLKFRFLKEIFEKEFNKLAQIQNSMLKLENNETIIKISDRILNTTDEFELKKIILEDIAHAFRADRTCFLSILSDFKENPVLENEFLRNPYIKSLKDRNLNFLETWLQMKKLQANPPVFVIENSENFVKQNKFEGTAADKFIRNSQIKSSYPFPVYETDEKTTYLIIQYTKDTHILDSGDFKILELISKQFKFALKQAKYYKKLKMNNQKEKLLVDIINLLRSEMKLSSVANEFIGKVGVYFSAQRCIIRFYDEKVNEFSGDRDAFEYKENYEIQSTKEFNLDEELREFLLYNEKFHDTFAVKYSRLINSDDFKFKNILIKYAEKHKIKAYMLAFIRHNKKFYGILSLHFAEEKDFSQEDENFIKTLADQLGIAIYQAELYYDIQNVAKKEKFLKEIFAESFTLKNKNEVYKYFSEKILQLFSAIGVAFIEFPNNKNEKIEFFEYYEKDSLNLKNFKNYKSITDFLNKKILAYSYELEHEKLNEEIIHFLEDNHLKSFATVPIPNNSLLVVFFSTKHEFNTFERNIITSLSEIIAKTIKEIMQNTQINNLRETFFSTLTHDLQVPLIAERNAINYLLKKNRNSDDEKIKVILENLKDTNLETENMLKALSAIYAYETQRKTLNNESCNLYDIVNDAISELNTKLHEKKIILKKKFESKNPLFYGDKIEILKVIILLLIYTCDYCKENTEIILSISDNNNYLKCCIESKIENGIENLKRIIFEKIFFYNALEQKIGEGIYLYLVKLIINQHNGKVYINNKGNDTNLVCIELEKINN